MPGPIFAVASSMFDVCVIGHVVWDRNFYGNLERKPQPGGVAYYASMTYCRLGLRTAVVTKVAAKDDGALLSDLRSNGVEVFNLPTKSTTSFENHYSVDNFDVRVQRVGSRAEAIRLTEIPKIRANTVHFGPLTPDDIELDVMVRGLSPRSTIALDAQGLVREIVDGAVVAKERVDHGHWLRFVDVLKVDAQELLIYAGSASPSNAVRRLLDRGVDELLVTEGGLGSTVFREGNSFPIDALRPRQSVDVTGCGDTFLAAYMAKRMASEDIEECGEFASAAASINLECSGPFKGTEEDVLRKLEAWERDERPGDRAGQRRIDGSVRDG
jgi:sugar/nucleoside kinase (ribokinase family)